MIRDRLIPAALPRAQPPAGTNHPRLGWLRRSPAFSFPSFAWGSKSGFIRAKGRKDIEAKSGLVFICLALKAHPFGKFGSFCKKRQVKPPPAKPGA